MVDLKALDLDRFYAGDRELLSEIYRAAIDRVERAVSRYCRGVDAECVIHDLFLGLIEKPEIRRQFSGGDLGAWLATIGARKAIDHLRRTRRMTLLDDPRSLEGRLEPVEIESTLLHQDQVRHINALLDRFQTEELPRLDQRLAQVFRLRFQEHRDQSDAARVLGIARTTFIEREQRLIARLGRFFKLCIKEGAWSAG